MYSIVYFYSYQRWYSFTLISTCIGHGGSGIVTTVVMVMATVVMVMATVVVAMMTT